MNIVNVVIDIRSKNKSNLIENFDKLTLYLRIAKVDKLMHNIKAQLFN